MQTQADEIVADLGAKMLSAEPETKVIALIAYLQKLGQSEDLDSAVARLEAPACRKNRPRFWIHV
jgi:cbb3-type cytochrome oxidase cytochrome c subunit